MIAQRIKSRPITEFSKELKDGITARGRMEAKKTVEAGARKCLTSMSGVPLTDERKSCQ